MSLGNFRVPDCWQTKRLGDCLSTIRNGLTNKQNKDGIGIPISRIETIAQEKIDASKVGYTDGLNGDQIENFKLQIGDLLFSHINSEPQLGKTAIYRGSPNLLIHGMNLLLLRVNECLQTEFLNFICKYFRQQGVFIALSGRAVGQSSINQGKLKDLKIPLPTKIEQIHIAAILSTVQRAIEQQERLIALTTELKKALMHKLFTEGTRGEPQKETEIGLVPESWGKTTLDQICKKPEGKIQTGPFGSMLHKEEYQTEGIPVVNPVNLDNNRINRHNIPRVSEKTAQRLYRYTLEQKDLLFSRRGEIGRHGIVTASEKSWICGTGCFIVRLSSKEVDAYFLNYYFSLKPVINWLERHAAGVIMLNLSNAVLSRVPIYLPKKEEQIEIARTIELIDRKISNHNKHRDSLNCLFRTLLHQLMTAQIRVNEIDLSALGLYPEPTAT